MLPLDPGGVLIAAAIGLPVAGGALVAGIAWLRRRLDPVAQGHEQRQRGLLRAAAGLGLAPVEDGLLEGVFDGRGVALGWGRAPLSPGAVPAEQLVLRVRLAAPPLAGLRLASRRGPPVAGARVPGMVVGAADPARLERILAQPGLVDQLARLGAAGAVQLDGRQLCLRLPPDARGLAPLVRAAVAVARAVAAGVQGGAPVVDGLGTLAAAQGLVPDGQGAHGGVQAGRRLRLWPGDTAGTVEVSVAVEVPLPAGLVVVGRDAPAAVRQRADAAPVPLDLDRALLPWRVAGAAPAAVRALLGAPGVAGALDAVVDDRGGRLENGAVVRVVPLALASLAWGRVVAPAVAAAAALEAAVRAPLAQLAADTGVSLSGDAAALRLSGESGGVALELCLDTELRLRAWPVGGAVAGLCIRARERGAPGGRSTGDVVLDTAAVVVAPGDLPPLTASAVLPLVAGRGATVEDGCLHLACDAVPPPARLAEILEEVRVLVPLLGAHGGAVLSRP